MTVTGLFMNGPDQITYRINKQNKNINDSLYIILDLYPKSTHQKLYQIFIYIYIYICYGIYTYHNQISIYSPLILLFYYFS